MRSEYGSLWETHQCRPHAYGHTWTPGYELPSGMLHGHAVSTGMGFGAYLSFCEGWTTRGELDRILSLLSNLELSLWHPIMEDVDRLYSAQEKELRSVGVILQPLFPRELVNADTSTTCLTTFWQCAFKSSTRSVKGTLEEA